MFIFIEITISENKHSKKFANFMFFAKIFMYEKYKRADELIISSSFVLVISNYYVLVKNITRISYNAKYLFIF